MSKEELLDFCAEYLKYNPLNGLLVWRKDNGRRTKKGTIAGSFSNGYIMVGIKGKKYHVHRIAWLMSYGELPCGHIDHVNHIRNDNRLLNLRDVSASDNLKNASKRSDNTSGVTGVSWHNRDSVWCAKIKVNDERVYLGSFANYSDAVNARKNAEMLYGYHSNHGKQRIK